LNTGILQYKYVKCSNGFIIKHLIFFKLKPTYNWTLQHIYWFNILWTFTWIYTVSAF
jgi:hypothetical protein